MYLKEKKKRTEQKKINNLKIARFILNTNT